MGEPIEKADADFVRERTGFGIGGVPPVGHHEPLATFVEERMLALERVWAAAGTPRAVFGPVTPAELAQATGGRGRGAIVTARAAPLVPGAAGSDRGVPVRRAAIRLQGGGQDVRAQQPARATQRQCVNELAAQLRISYPAVARYHLNKRHWNTITLDGSLDDALVFDMLEDSYDLRVAAAAARARAPHTSGSPPSCRRGKRRSTQIPKPRSDAMSPGSPHFNVAE